MRNISSMTGYATGVTASPEGSINVELRSVNHRNLDLQFRSSEEFRSSEPQFRRIIQNRVSRGKIECRIGRTASSANTSDLRVNDEALLTIRKLYEHMNGIIPNLKPISINEILGWPGVLSEKTEISENLVRDTKDLLNITLDKLLIEKNREGDSLAGILLSRIHRISKLIRQIEPLLPNIMKKIEKKLLVKFEDARLNPDQDRLQQELIFYAAKIDLDEEIERLKVHLNEAENILNSGGVCGKKLDFLAQELNRETNTLSAKSIDFDVTKIAIEIKTLIEQFREQIQNIE